jgi:hypothetical protein
MIGQRDGRRALHGLLLAAVVLGALVGCGGDGDSASSEKTFSHDDFAISFKYPGNLKTSKVGETAQSAGGEPVAQTALAVDEANAIFLAKYDVNAEVTKENIATFVPQVDEVVEQLTGNPIGGTTVAVGGLPGVRYDDVALANPPQGQSRLVFLFDGSVEYLVNCQSTPEERAKITRACDRVLTTMSKG